MTAKDIRRGMVILYSNVPHRVLDCQHRTPGNLRAFVQAKLRNIVTGLSTEARFSSTEAVERVTLEQHEMEFLYESDGLYNFMNTENFEQVALDGDVLGDAVNYLIPNSRIVIEFHDVTPMGVELPKTIDLKVTDTPPGLKTATVTNALKPATTETGLVVQVPNFINTGDVIRVDTETGAYLQRGAKG